MVSCEFSFPKCEIEKHKQRQAKMASCDFSFPKRGVNHSKFGVRDFDLFLIYDLF